MDNTKEEGQSRLLKSAKALKAYFEQKLNSSPATRDAIEELIETAVRMELERDDLHSLQSRLESTHEELPSNVIPFRRGQVTRGSGYEKPVDKNWILRLDCLIESQYISEIHKMAMELHSHTRRYAFIEYRDLDKKTRMNIPDLLALGAISLFVPSILDLTMDEQEVLRQLTAQDTVNRPLLMVGSTISYADLRCEASVHLDFLAVLSRAYIKLSKPFHEYKDQGLIHYFLDSLSQSPT